jgi:hypothetical protein
MYSDIELANNTSRQTTSIIDTNKKKLSGIPKERLIIKKKKRQTSWQRTMNNNSGRFNKDIKSEEEFYKQLKKNYFVKNKNCSELSK